MTFIHTEPHHGGSRSAFLLKVRRCRNWAEYRELLARREGRRKGRPAHLWNREVTPLHDPRQPIPTSEITQIQFLEMIIASGPFSCIWFNQWCFFFIPEELLDKLSVIKSTHLLEDASRYHVFLLLLSHRQLVRSENDLPYLMSVQSGATESSHQTFTASYDIPLNWYRSVWQGFMSPIRLRVAWWAGEILQVSRRLYRRSNWNQQGVCSS